ncbi:MAG TPA: group 1 glycosyl transferase, partial [Parafilimonas sp.]|nr:group 1 glycosyl transferase [Parafilimonas sp.]
MKHIVFTVTNDLDYDQRMQRICTSLANAGYNVLLVGRKLNTSVPLQQQVFQQKRLRCVFNKKFLFYTEYNLRLFFFLLFTRMDAVCAIDLDTIIPCYFVSRLRNKLRIYDAHELFSEMKEVITRPRIKKMWSGIEKYSVPKFADGYTVSESIAEEFRRRYGVRYSVIRNVPVEKQLAAKQSIENKIFLYQGAINEARGLEALVEVMNYVDAELHLYGDGNIDEQIRKLIRGNRLEKKVIMKGKILPAELYDVTQHAYAGINLVEPAGLNQLYSLSNKFFDYIQAGIPQLTMDFQEYKKINDEYQVAVLTSTINVME